MPFFRKKDPGSAGSKAGERANPDEQPKQRPPGYFEGEDLTRRKLFERGAVAASGLAGAAVGIPAIGFALAPVFEEEEIVWSTVGTTDEFDEDTYVPRILTIVTGVGEAGKTTAYVRKRNPDLDPPSPAEEGFIAISTRCTHLGCPASYVEPSKKFVCPCHTTIYDYLGRRESGPAPRGMDRFRTRVVREGDKELVQLGPRFSVTDKLEPVAPRDPSQPVDPETWRYIYPTRPSVRNWDKGMKE